MSKVSQTSDKEATFRQIWDFLRIHPSNKQMVQDARGKMGCLHPNSAHGASLGQRWDCLLDHKPGLTTVVGRGQDIKTTGGCNGGVSFPPSPIPKELLCCRLLSPLALLQENH